MSKSRFDAPVLSAELHYFRTPRDDWELMLARMRQMGASVITTAVPWSWHAPTPDVYDLVGDTHPQRDLSTFVTLCGYLGLSVILNPGPIVDAGLLGDGIPPWLLAHYPEIHMLQPDGQPLRDPLSGLPRVCVSHPTYLQHSYTWITTFSNALASWHFPIKPLIAIQTDTNVYNAYIHSSLTALEAPFVTIVDWLSEEQRLDPLFSDVSTESSIVVARMNLRGFSLASLFVNAVNGLNVYPTTQSHAEPPEVSARLRWGMEAPVRPDGSVQIHFWNAKIPFTLLNAVGNDFGNSHVPTDLVLDYVHIAEQIEPISGAELGTLMEQLEGQTRHGWADQSDIHVLVRHGKTTANNALPVIYLLVTNYRVQPYSGMVAYRTPDGTIEHIHLTVGAGQVGMLLIRDNEVLGAALGGNAFEGSWVARGLNSSIVWNGGAAVIAPYIDTNDRNKTALLISAPQNGRLNLRRNQSWDELIAYRLLLDGNVLPATFQTDQTHLILPYVAEDELGQTDAYLIVSSVDTLPSSLQDYLGTLLKARIHMLERSVRLLASEQELGDLTLPLYTAIELLNMLILRSYTLEEYRNIYISTVATIQPVVNLLTQSLARLRGKQAMGVTPSTDIQTAMIEQTLGMLARANLVYDRE